MQIEQYGITTQQYRFVQLYVQHLNASKAAEEAGYSKQMGTALLSRPNIIDAVEAFAKEIDEANILSAKETLRELSHIAKTKMSDLYKLPEHISEEASGAIQEIELTAEGHIKKIKTYSRLEALDKLARIHGQYITKHEHSGPKGKAIEVNHKYEDMDQLIEKMDEMLTQNKIKQVEAIDIPVRESNE